MPKLTAAANEKYLPFTRDAAVRVARQFGIADQADALFKLIILTTENYERYRLMPDYHQRKDALQKLRSAVSEVALVAAKHERALELSLHGTLLRRLGELLSYGGIRGLLDSPMPGRPWCPEEEGWEDFPEKSRLDRSVEASQAGPKLLIGLFREMLAELDDALKGFPTHTGGKPTKYPYREVIIAALGWDFRQLFGKRPTSTGTGKFAKFCKAVLQELEVELDGFEDALPKAMKKGGLLPKKKPTSIQPGKIR